MKPIKVEFRFSDADSPSPVIEMSRYPLTGDAIVIDDTKHYMVINTIHMFDTNMTLTKIVLRCRRS